MYYMIRMFNFKHCLEKLQKRKNKTQPVQRNANIYATWGCANIDFNPYWVSINNWL